jgi:hypothetical protein
VPTQDQDRQRLGEYVSEVIDRLAAEANLDDFLLWAGGTLEYWVHIVASSIGQSQSWAARTEVPYITGAPAVSAKTPRKWADGAVLFDNGLLALLEVKTIPMREALGSSAVHIPGDLAALISTDWPATIELGADGEKYPDTGWWTAKATPGARPWGVVIAAVHGAALDARSTASFKAALAQGTGRVRYRHRDLNPPWLDVLDAAMGDPLVDERVVAGTASKARFSAWAVPISTH